MNKALHRSNDVDRLYVSRKEGGRGIDCIQDSVDASIQRREDNIKMCRKTDYSHQKQYRQHKHQ